METEQRFVVKMKVIGRKYGEVSEASEQGWEYEGDQRHADPTVTILKFGEGERAEHAKRGSENQEKGNGLQCFGQCEGEVSSAQGWSKFMTQDRADTQYGDMWRKHRRLKRSGRCSPILIGLPVDELVGPLVEGSQ